MTGTGEYGWNKEIVISKRMREKEEQIEKRGEKRERRKRRIAGKERIGGRGVGKGWGREEEWKEMGGVERE